MQGTYCTLPLEEGMATHCSIFAWRIPCTEEPGRLWAIMLQRLGHNWSDLACMHVLYLDQAYNALFLLFTWQNPAHCWELSAGSTSLGKSSLYLLLVLLEGLWTFPGAPTICCFSPLLILIRWYYYYLFCIYLSAKVEALRLNCQMLITFVPNNHYLLNGWLGGRYSPQQCRVWTMAQEVYPLATGRNWDWSFRSPFPSQEWIENNESNRTEEEECPWLYLSTTKDCLLLLLIQRPKRESDCQIALGPWDNCPH